MARHRTVIPTGGQGQAWFELELDATWPPRAWFELELDSSLGQGGIPSGEAFGTPTVTVVSAPVIEPPPTPSRRGPARIAPARRRRTQRTFSAPTRVAVSSTTRVRAAVSAHPARVLTRSGVTRSGVLAHRNRVSAGSHVAVTSATHAHAGQAVRDGWAVRTLATTVTRRDGPDLEEALLLGLL